MRRSEEKQREKTDGIAIGDVSRRTGVNIETIRYYEKIKMLPLPPRTKSGRRVYGQGEVRRLSFIRRARELGFTLDEVRALLRLVERGYSCGEVQDLTRHHLAEVNQKIADLRRIERLLRKTSEQCAGGKVPECPIIDVLFGER
jgi:MerR family mercuric resistance operon transcriptional regulator